MAKITAREMRNRWAAISAKSIAGDVIDQNLDELADLNKQQLMRGESAKGGYLSPRHTQHPFFKGDIKRAMQYARWKKKITPLTPWDTPNLFVNGYTHSHLRVVRQGETLLFNWGTLSWGAEIDDTYKGQDLGLNEESKVQAWNEVLRTPYVQRVAALTGCRIIKR